VLGWECTRIASYPRKNSLPFDFVTRTPLACGGRLFFMFDGKSSETRYGAAVMTDPSDEPTGSTELEQITCHLQRLHEETDEFGVRLAQLRENLDQAVDEKRKTKGTSGATE
jgi:hypothetical protein